MGVGWLLCCVGPRQILYILFLWMLWMDININIKVEKEYLDIDIYVDIYRLHFWLRKHPNKSQPQAFQAGFPCPMGGWVFWFCCVQPIDII